MLTQNGKMQKLIEKKEIQKRKWERRKSSCWFLLPTGGNGLLSIMFGLQELELSSLSLGVKIALGFNCCIVAAGSLFWILSRVMIWRTNSQVREILRKLTSND